MAARRPVLPTMWALFALSLLMLSAGGAAAFYLNQHDQAKAEFADLILAHPDSVAIAAYTVDNEGLPVADGLELFHNADRPLVMASAMKTIILAAYADAVASGAIDPGERVRIADVERFYLPGTDGDAHKNWLKRLGLATDERGFARDQLAIVTLDDIATTMIHDSANAGTDFLIGRLGQERIRTVMTKAGFVHHSPMRPKLILGVALALTNHDKRYATMDEMRTYADRVAAGDTAFLDALADKYLTDAAWRAAQIESMATMPGPPAGLDVWAYNVLAAELFPKGTAREYASMMARVMKDRFLSPKVSQIMRRKLETAPSFEKMQKPGYRRYGAKHGATAGVLTVVSYMVPRSGPAKKKDRVVVLLTNQLPADGWVKQFQQDGIDHLSVDLAQADGSFGRLRDINQGRQQP